MQSGGLEKALLAQNYPFISDMHFIKNQNIIALLMEMYTLLQFTIGVN